MNDWRQDAGVVAARAAHVEAQGRVLELEANIRAAAAQARTKEAALQAAEEAGELEGVVSARAAALAARNTVTVLGEQAGALYAAYAEARGVLAEAEAAAKAASWPGARAEYKAAVEVLQARLADALEAEEVVDVLGRRMMDLYGGVDGWVKAPDGGRLASGSFVTRRLARESFEAWCAWVAEGILTEPEPPLKRQVKRLAADLRGMVRAA